MTYNEKFEMAEKLFESYTAPGSASYDIGRKAKDLLLSGRSVAELTERETSLLLEAYNWMGEHKEAFVVARRSVEKWGEAFVMDLSRAHLNAYWWKKDRFLSEADKLIEDRIASPAFWHVRKADLFVGEATGERYKEEEWRPGDPIVDGEALRLAAAELTAALNAGAASNPALMENWNERYASIFSAHEYAHLQLYGAPNP